MAAIWKDFFVNIVEPQVYYRVKLDTTAGPIIQQGMAVAEPGDTVKIRLNGICRPFLYTTFPDFRVYTDRSFVDDANMQREFVVEYSTDGQSWSVAGNFPFNDDWSFDPISPVGQLSRPVSNLISRNQHILFSTLGDNNLRMRVFYENGTSSEFTLGGHPAGTLIIDPAASVYEGAVRFVILGANAMQNYTVANPDCYRFVLYYINAYGGIDSLLVTGKTVKTDTYSRKRFGQVVDNNSIEHEKRDYANEITRTWELHTDWLTDAEAARMHLLLGSTKVWLQDLETFGDVLEPVLITNSDCRYKTFETNGRKMASYVITVENSQNITRR